MLNRDSEFEVDQHLCGTCEMNSTLGSVVPLGMFQLKTSTLCHANSPLHCICDSGLRWKRRPRTLGKDPWFQTVPFLNFLLTLAWAIVKGQYFQVNIFFISQEDKNSHIIMCCYLVGVVTTNFPTTKWWAKCV